MNFFKSFTCTLENAKNPQKRDQEYNQTLINELCEGKVYATFLKNPETNYTANQNAEAMILKHFGFSREFKPHPTLLEEVQYKVVFIFGTDTFVIMRRFISEMSFSIIINGDTVKDYDTQEDLDTKNLFYAIQTCFDHAHKLGKYK